MTPQTAVDAASQTDRPLLHLALLGIVGAAVLVVVLLRRRAK